MIRSSDGQTVILPELNVSNLKAIIIKKKTLFLLLPPEIPLLSADAAEVSFDFAVFKMKSNHADKTSL